jgi:hypothetical protein
MDRVHVVIVSDGIDKLSEEYQTNLESVGIMSVDDLKDFKKLTIEDGNEGIEFNYSKLNFINHDNMNMKQREYGTYNVGH